MANAGILYDKYAVIPKLQKRGFPHEQPEVVGEVLTGADLSALTTRNDLKDEIRNLEIRLYKSMFTAMAAQTALIVGLIQLLK
jgi:hypothetical protein